MQKKYIIISLILDITSYQLIHEVEIFSLQTFPWSVGLDHQVTAVEEFSNIWDQKQQDFEAKVRLRSEGSYTENIWKHVLHFLRVSSFLSFRCSCSFQIHILDGHLKCCGSEANQLQSVLATRHKQEHQAGKWAGPMSGGQWLSPRDFPGGLEFSAGCPGCPPGGGKLPHFSANSKCLTKRSLQGKAKT